jgi:hypothetical protein
MGFGWRSFGSFGFFGWRFFGLLLRVSLTARSTAAGIRPARASNFLLLRQKKVTKEEALNPQSTVVAGLAKYSGQKRSASLSRRTYPEADGSNQPSA